MAKSRAQSEPPAPRPHTNRAPLTLGAVSALEAAGGAGTGGGREKSSEPAGHEPQCARLAPPRTHTGSPALTVLCGGNPRANIIVVPISVVAAAALCHALHPVLVEERLAGRALRVAAWVGWAGRRLTARAGRCALLLSRRLCLPVPGADTGRQEPLAPSPVCSPGVTRCGLPTEACPHLPGLAGPSGKAHWGSGRSSDRGPRRAGNATRTPRVGCSSRRTKLSGGERGCGRLLGSPSQKGGISGCCTPRVPGLLLVPALRLAPREPSLLGAMCLSGFYTQEHVRTQVVDTCPCVCTHARQAPERPQLHLRPPPGAARLTADVRGPPGHAHARFVAGLGVGGHGGAKALAVGPRVAGAGVAHAGLVVPGGVDLGRGGGCSAG